MFGYCHLGDDEFIDGVDITPDEIYTWSDKVNKTPKTSTKAEIPSLSHICIYSFICSFVKIEHIRSTAFAPSTFAS